MSHIDDTIREALRRDDPAGPDADREQSLLKEALDVFRTRRRWAAMASVALSLAIMAVAAFTAVRFFEATDTKTMIAWSVGFLVCIIAVSMLKVWFWMEMERGAILRELKRLEVQVARLAERPAAR